MVPSQPIEKDITENTMQEEISSIPKNQMSKIEEKKDEEKKDTVKEEIKVISLPLKPETLHKFYCY